MSENEVTPVLVVRVRRADDPIAVEMQVLEQAVRDVVGPEVEGMTVSSAAEPELAGDHIVFLRGSSASRDNATARCIFGTTAARDAYYHKMRPALAAWAVKARKQMAKGKPLPPDEGWETWTFDGEE